MKKKLRKLLAAKAGQRGRKQSHSDQAGDPKSAARITNETVAAHREEVIGKARKYIYPLQHSKHRVVVISISLFVATLVAFFSYCTLALYKFQSNSTFLYRVTQIIPFPIARTGSQFIAYENYLFELRRYMHYYETQQELDFDSEAGQRQLAQFKTQALEKVIDDAFIKQLAKEQDVTVGAEEVDKQIDIVRSQNRLGDSEEVFEDVLKDFWGWSVDDFERSLRQRLLAQKLLAKLDTETQQQAKLALEELEGGSSFAAVARKYSDDPAVEESGGEFGVPVDQANRDLTAETTTALFALEPGETSDIINIGYALEIVKVLEKEDDQVKGAHILFNFKNISTYLDDLKEEQKTRLYITLPASDVPDPDMSSPPEQ